MPASLNRKRQLGHQAQPSALSPQPSTLLLILEIDSQLTLWAYLRQSIFAALRFCKILLILSKTILFEVGGANKRRKQLPRNSENEFLAKDGILVGSRRTIPLHLLGFLY
jgi:hypothetical protein